MRTLEGYFMKKFYLVLVLILNTFTFSCAKKTETQTKIDEFLNKYESLVEEFKGVVAKVEKAKDSELNFESFSEIIDILPKINEMEEALKKIDIKEFTDEQKERFEKLSQSLNALAEDIDLNDE